jgi:succinate dehydrogenase / fumarate reductase cytochrome b subunit
MRWGGVVIAAFVVYHVLHLTLGTAHHDFSHESAYRNVVSGFRRWPVAAAYTLAMIPLATHVYHGLWSATRTLGAERSSLLHAPRPLAAAVALAIFAGNVSVPVAVLAGVVR